MGLLSGAARARIFSAACNRRCQLARCLGMKTFPSSPARLATARMRPRLLHRGILLGLVALLVFHVPEAPAEERGWGVGLMNRVTTWFREATAMDDTDLGAWTEIMETLETAKTQSATALLQSRDQASQGSAAFFRHLILRDGYDKRRQHVDRLIETLKTGLISGGEDAPALLSHLNLGLAELERSEALFAENDCTKHPVLWALARTAVGLVIEAGISAAVETWLDMKQEQRQQLLEQLEAKKWDSSVEVLRLGGNRPTLGRPAF